MCQALGGKAGCPIEWAFLLLLSVLGVACLHQRFSWSRPCSGFAFALTAGQTRVASSQLFLTLCLLEADDRKVAEEEELEEEDN